MFFSLLFVTLSNSSHLETTRKVKTKTQVLLNHERADLPLLKTAFASIQHAEIIVYVM